MKPAPRLLVHGITVAGWSRRFGVEAFTYPCSECGSPCTTSIPFAQGTIRGLQAPPCACGNEQTPFAFALDHNATKGPNRHG